MLKLNKEYKVADKTIKLQGKVTTAGKRILLVRMNKSTCFVSFDDVLRKGLIKALSNLRRFNNSLTVSQYTLIGSVIGHLDILRRTGVDEFEHIPRKTPRRVRVRSESEMAYVTGRPTPSHLYRPAIK